MQARRMHGNEAMQAFKHVRADPHGLRGVGRGRRERLPYCGQQRQRQLAPRLPRRRAAPACSGCRLRRRRLSERLQSTNTIVIRCSMHPRRTTDAAKVSLPLVACHDAVCDAILLTQLYVGQTKKPACAGSWLRR